MPEKPRGEQLPLSLDESTTDTVAICRGVFSLPYIRGHFVASGDCPAQDEVRALYDATKTRWHDNLPGLRKQKEAYTRTAFLDPLLVDLGWQFIPEAELPKGPTRKRPDYCLFPTPEFRQAATQSDTVDVFRFADTALEAKKWQHPLDEVSDKETPGWFPSQQIQDYLRHAKDKTGSRFFDWAVLTNGNSWRLYCDQAANDAFFEFRLADGETFCSLDDFRLFVALFRPSSFARTDGRCLLDNVREESLTRQAQLELSLRKRIFDVLEDLANGFRDHAPNQITKADFPALYDNSLIFLYRLLFVLYAESRALLPVRPHGYGSNKLYREKYSLAGLVAELRDKTKFHDDAFTDLYDQLTKLFRLINGDNEAQNRATTVARYNGGLFNPQMHARLEQWKVGDATLARVLKQLIFSQPPARASAKQQQIATNEAIDYGSLEVRQLGDIYEGLLGAQLAENSSGRLELRNQNGENHRHGIFYTPDWIVRYLLRETVEPLLAEIERGKPVSDALTAKSDEKKRDNSFALAVLRLNLVDPAMGSGHFLVRATEWLAEQIVYHPTTRVMTEQIVHSGPSRRTREDILKAGKIPVPPGISQEQAEIAYWRRRVVEACIYGVDVNPLAVELTKLSLWLTCIAADEPLNFLDHHLRAGNSLLSASPTELGHSPTATAQQRQEAPVFAKNELPNALAELIRENVDIELTASTEMELVKHKEQRWKEVRGKFAPFVYCADVWLAAYDGLPLDELNYRLLVRAAITPGDLDSREKAEVKKLRESLAQELAAKRTALNPFHWELEFADVFFQTDGQPRPAAERGFDVILGNPPYISTHTSSAEGWRNALENRAGFLDDLYVHFAALGFQLLRPGGGFGLIVSDTFFTLASKERMRVLLQSHTLTHLGQCDPFDATVDAAIFVARKFADANGAKPATPDDTVLFVQARPRKTPDGRTTKPEKALETLPPAGKLAFTSKTKLPKKLGEAQHTAHGPGDTLRVHRVPTELYRLAHKRAFFEPRLGTLQLFEKFNEPVKQLVDEWWERIETSQKFADNMTAIRVYQEKLKPGDVTLVGLVAEGGQGMRTANNARFLGYLVGTSKADAILVSREQWTKRWLHDARIKPVFLELLQANGGDAGKPTKDSAAWEACVETLRAQFKAEQLGFTKSDLYRVVPKELVADESDFKFAWQQRKTELFQRWRSEPNLADFWLTELKESEQRQRARTLHKAKSVSDEDFCLLCQELQHWIPEENASRKKQKKPLIPRDAIGLRSAENYTDPADAPRIATIYNGLSGRGRFVPFRKGDSEGNRWVDNETLFIDWSHPNVVWFFANSGRPESGMPVMRNAHLYLTTGVTWTAVANHVAMKARFQERCVFDADSMRLTPLAEVIAPLAFLALLNSDVVSFIKMKFIKHTQKWEIGDLRQIPIVMPTSAQAATLENLANLATTAKRLVFAGQSPSHELAATARALGDALEQHAPAYLHPSAQRKLLATATDCLEVIELAVNWEAEKLYGVEALGPFDEF
ncbi:MAG: Eco57I restriction-modification methylase domain-containing protein [Verrucomicrobiota bacterium]